LLEKGFKVRVATRSVAKQSAFKSAFEAKYGQDHIEFIEIDDFASSKSWDLMLNGEPFTSILSLSARPLTMLGVQGVQHLASDVSFSIDYESVMEGTRAMTTTFLTSAQKQESVKSVVLTSSRIAAYNPVHGKDIHVTKNDWTDYFLDLAKNAEVDDPMKPMMTCKFLAHASTGTHG
jgi:nucleoside-diphosphate-sugar epimerase